MRYCEGSIIVVVVAFGADGCVVAWAALPVFDEGGAKVGEAVLADDSNEDGNEGEGEEGGVDVGYEEGFGVCVVREYVL